jgi:aconitate hydratase
VLPLEFANGESCDKLGITGAETYDLDGVDGTLQPRQQLTLIVHRPGQSDRRVTLTLRLDTPTEIAYLRHGGILPHALRALLAAPRR